MAGYSLLYPPLAALAGTRLVGVVAGVAAVGLFAVLARRRAPTPAAGGARRLAVPRRRDEQRRDRPDAVHARHRARGRRLGVRAPLAGSRPRRCRSPACWASPVAGVFLAVAAVATLAGARSATAPRAAGLATRWRSARPRWSAGSRWRRCSPRAAPTTSSATAFWPMLLVCLGALALVDPTRRTALWAAAHLRRGARRRVRVPELARPERAAARRGARPGAARALRAARARRASRSRSIAVALLYLQWLPAVRAVEEARGDPSTQAAFHAEVLRFLDAHATPGERLEVPLTRNHWEATYLAESYPLARGWHRQLDRKVNPLFYDAEHPLTSAALRALAARQRGPLGRAAGRAARLLRRGGARSCSRRGCRTSKPVHDVAATGGSGRSATPGRRSRARRSSIAAGADGFDLEATGPGDVLVRQHGTPYWTVAAGDGCVSRGPRSGWTLVDVRRRRAGCSVRARFSALGALRREPRCARRRRAGAAPSAVSPPVTGR